MKISNFISVITAEILLFLNMSLTSVVSFKDNGCSRDFTHDKDMMKVKL